MTVGINSNLCKSVVLSDPDETVYAKGTVTTTSTSKTKVVEHTVTSGNDFYVLAYSLARQTNNSAGASPITLEVETSPGTTTVFDSGAWDDGSAQGLAVWSESRDTGIKIATGGNKVQLYIKAGRTQTTVWFGKIVGVERAS